jgi:broad-specificity NMP kinase
MIHDPVKNYPWMRLALFENLYWSLFTSDRKGINIDFYKRMKDLNWHGDVINFNYTKESLSEISFQFLNFWEGKVSLLDLPKRLHETKVDEVKDISDTKILRLLVSALEKTEKDSRYQNVK